MFGIKIKGFKKKVKTKNLKPTVKEWLEKLRDDEKAPNTLKQYSRSLNKFSEFLELNEIEEITKKNVIAYKEAMLDEMDRNLKNPKPGRTQLKSVTTINIRLRALNAFLKDAGLSELTVKLLKDESNNTLDDMLTEKEYSRILEWAYKLGRDRTALIIETLTGTGIRISELEYITVESLKSRVATVRNKGKIRKIFIPKQLAKKLKAYCKENGITEGIIFHGRDKTKMLNQTNLRKDLKNITGKARGVKRDKAHFHNFRHFFAKRYANMPGANPYILPALLGHSDKTQTMAMGVTALYTKPTTKELLKAVDDLEAYYSKKG